MTKARYSWPETIQTNVLRYLIAGIVFAAIAVGDGSFSLGELPVFLAVAPLVILICFALPGWVLVKLGDFGLPLGKFIGCLFFLPVMIADPVMWVLNKMSKRVVPVDRYGFLCPMMLVPVLLPGSEPIAMQSDPASHEEQPGPTSECPYAGDIRLIRDLAYECGTLAKHTVLSIKENWWVEVNHSKWGWASEDGGLYDGSPGLFNGDTVNPRAAAMKLPAARIEKELGGGRGGMCFDGKGEHVGDLQ